MGLLGIALRGVPLLARTYFPRPPAATGPARNSGPARRPIPTGFRPHGPVGNRPPRRSSSGAYLLSAASRGNRTGTEANPYRVPAAWACRESPSAAFLFWRSTFFPRRPVETGPARNSGPARRPIPTGFRPHGPVGNRPPRRSSSGAYLLSAASRGNRTGTEADPYRVPAAWACRESPSAAFLFWRVPSFRGLPRQPDRHGGRSLQGSGRMGL